MRSARVFWLFGFSGAGKSTLGDALTHALEAESGSRWLRLDGDRMRAGLCKGLGFDEHGRTENLRRAAEVARLALESGISVVASFITPLRAHRKLIDDVVGPGMVIWIHVATPLQICQSRDVKGLYTGRGGAVSPSSSPFEVPGEVDISLRLNARSETLERAVADLVGFARAAILRCENPGESPQRGS